MITNSTDLHINTIKMSVVHARHAYRKYSQETLLKVINLVSNKQMSAYKAAKEYGIPKSTILDKVAGRVPVICKSGPDPVLSMEEENKLVDWAIKMCMVGYPVTRTDLKNTVKLILDRQNRKSVFQNNLPGNDWIYGLFKRHPELTERRSQALGKERAVVSTQQIEGWFAGQNTL